MSFPRSGQPAASIPTIAIIGGGLSGAMVAAHLLQRARVPLAIYLIERRSQVGSGVAYSTPLDCHVLNVPAGNLSVMEGATSWQEGSDRPSFLAWLHEVAGASSVAAQDFVPRHWFGQYVRAELQEAIARRHPDVQISIMQDEAVQISVADHHATVHLGRGQRLQVDRVVLALGNLPPAPVPIENPQFYQSPAYIDSGWADALDSVLEHPSLLLLGAGLTAVDWLVALRHRGYEGAVHLLSRRGLLPQAHSTYAMSSSQAPIGFIPESEEGNPLPNTVRELTRWIRRRVAIAQTLGYDWRTVFDSLRPYTQALWQQLSLDEKRRFLRHLRPYWDSYRHRIAPQVHQIVQEMRVSGQLRLHSGWLKTCHERDGDVTVQFRPRGQSALETLSVRSVINCTGPHLNYRELRHPLICSLLHQGLARCDALRLGLDTAPNGALLNARGVPSSWLYTLGPTRRGQLWETTAIQEIRIQAAALATLLLMPTGESAVPPGSTVYISATH